jgi:MFS family permease
MAPVFGQRLALGEGQIALFMGATIFGGAMLQWPIGHISDRIDRRSVLIMVSFATATTGRSGESRNRCFNTADTSDSGP